MNRAVLLVQHRPQDSALVSGVRACRQAWKDTEVVSGMRREAAEKDEGV